MFGRGKRSRERAAVVDAGFVVELRIVMVLRMAWILFLLRGVECRGWQWCAWHHAMRGTFCFARTTYGMKANSLIRAEDHGALDDRGYGARGVVAMRGRACCPCLLRAGDCSIFCRVSPDPLIILTAPGAKVAALSLVGRRGRWPPPTFSFSMSGGASPERSPSPRLRAQSSSG
jgi:hypothetical protein